MSPPLKPPTSAGSIESGSGASRVQRTKPSLAGEPEATPSVNGELRHFGRVATACTMPGAATRLADAPTARISWRLVNMLTASVWAARAPPTPTKRYSLKARLHCHLERARRADGVQRQRRRRGREAAGRHAAEI